VGGDQLVELRHRRVVVAGGQVGVDPVLQRAQAQLLQPRHRGGREPGGSHVGQRRPPPQRQRLPQRPPGLPGVAGQLPPPGRGERPEADDIHGVGVERQPIARLVRLDHVGEQATQPCDQRLQGVGRARGRVLVPDRVDQ
jgi:hypothetical protein